MAPSRAVQPRRPATAAAALPRQPRCEVAATNRAMIRSYRVVDVYTAIFGVFEKRSF